MRRWGLALGGGAVLGYAHLGVLETMAEAGLRPDALSGTSAGAFIASLYAFGVPLVEMDRLLRGLRWKEITALSLASGGLFSNRELGDVLRATLGEARIEDAPLPLAVVAADVVSGEPVVFRSGDLASAVMASSCIPGLYVPVEVEGRLLVDGALVEDVPVSPLGSMGAEVRVGVSLLSRPRYRPPRSLLEVLVNAADIAILTNTRLQLAAADVAIVPDLGDFDHYDTAQLPALHAAGRRAGRAALPRLHAALQIETPPLPRP